MKPFAKTAFCLAMLMGTSAAHAAAICGGKWALITTYTCDGSPLYKTAKCILVGRDKNQDGKWDDGDEFKTRFEDEAWQSVDYAKACTGDNAHLCDKPEKAQCLS
ncbi:hypothetical protein [Chromobacterium sp. CV08]|uniref:hypothetical protein n=1 Tax=Chromobacterium sp. CV08 TaxID=3133274 RepID=UPI003DA9DC74